MSKRSVPIIMTFIVILFIFILAGTARWSLRFNNKCSTAVTSNNVDLINDKGLNSSEKQILTGISNLIIFSDNKADEVNQNQNIYFGYLNKYLSRPEVNLDADTANQIKELIKDRDEIMYLEKENEVSKMSFDGRKATIHVLEQIYELCGLKLDINMEGEIEKITDISGTITYQFINSESQAKFQVNTLVIILTIIQTLLCVCFIISRRNQIFIKGGRYDGFNEKKIA